MKKIHGILLICALGVSLFGGIACLKSKPAVRPVEVQAADETVTITVDPSKYSSDGKNGRWNKGNEDYARAAHSGTVNDITVAGNFCQLSSSPTWRFIFYEDSSYYGNVSSTKYYFKQIDFSFYNSYGRYLTNFNTGNYAYEDAYSREATWTAASDTDVSLVSFKLGGVAMIQQMTITAGPVKFSLSYNANGGSGEMVDPSSPYSYKTKVVVLENSFVAPEGKKFSHWNTKADGSGTSYNAGAQITMTSDLTLYAQYAGEMTVNVNGYTGKYDGEEHTGEVSVTVPESGYVVKYGTSESSVTLTDCPTFSEVGEHNVYYAVTANGYADEKGSFQIIIKENDKTELNSLLAKANALFESLDDKTTTEAVALQTAITAAQAVSENQNVTVKQIADVVDALNVAIAPLGSEVITDEDSGTSVQAEDGTLIPNSITLTVEVRADVKAEEGSAEREAIQAKLASDEEIAKVFDVKLIKNEGGVETEIQPSDIKEGMKLIVEITVPSDVSTEGLKILHIHSESEMEFIESFELADGKVSFEVSKLSEMAFINKAAAPTPVDPISEGGLPGWGIALIVIGAILLLACGAWVLFMFVLNKWIKVEDKAIRAFKLFGIKKDGKFIVWGFPFKFVLRDGSEIYKTKEQALK